MIKHLLVALMLSMVIIGCDSEIWGTHFSSPHSFPIERPAVPAEDQVLDDLEDAQSGRLRGATVDSEVISVDSRIYIVLVEKDSEVPVVYKVTYYLR